MALPHHRTHSQAPSSNTSGGTEAALPAEATAHGSSGAPTSGGSAAGGSSARKRSQQALDDYLTALFPMRVEEASPSGALDGRVADQDAVWIERERIEPNPAQPRRTWSHASLRDLGQSLARDGQLQACVVRPHPSRSGFYQLVSGERRWRASGPEFASLERLRCTIREVGDDESLRLALVENLQREDLNDIDKAQAFVDLRDSLRASDPRVTWSHIGQAVGLSREHLQRLKALLDLPAEVQEMVRGNTLSGRSARVLTGLKDAEMQLHLAREIQRDRLSSDQALERARSLSAPRISGKPEERRPSVAREAQAGSNPQSEAWEEPLRQAVLLLAQAREHSAQSGKRSRKSKKLIEQARAHIEALEAASA